MNETDDFIPTRESLLGRLKDWKDEESWRVFFDTYWRLIYNAAIRAGLTESEAEDVVQETVLSVFKSMPRFQYDAEKGSFKNWLMRLTGWRITDQLRKRGPTGCQSGRETEGADDTPIIERVADPVGLKLEALWDEEWERNLMQAAVASVRRRVDPQQYQVFDLYVVKGWPVSKVARTLRINPARVYLIKHRINHLIKREIIRLQTRPI